MPTGYDRVEMLIRDILLKKPKGAEKESEVYIVSAVADGIGDKPLQVQSMICEGITPYQTFPISGDGFVIYRNPPGELPEYLDYAIAVMESDAGYRDMGKLIKQVTASDDFASVQSQIVSAVASGGPWLNLAVGVLRIAAGFLETNADDPLLKTVGSLTRALDYRSKELLREESHRARMFFDARVFSMDPGTSP